MHGFTSKYALRPIDRDVYSTVNCNINQFKAKLNFFVIFYRIYMESRTRSRLSKGDFVCANKVFIMVSRTRSRLLKVVYLALSSALILTNSQQNNINLIHDYTAFVMTLSQLNVTILVQLVGKIL